MKLKKKYISIDVDVFEEKLQIWICTREEAKRKLTKAVGLNDTNFDVMQGSCLNLEPHGFHDAVWVNSLSSKKDIVVTLAHELIHACFRILERSNIKDEETITTLHTFLLTKTLKEFKIL